jgi:branched-chain amino acid transport system substrate-binding protein
MKKRNFIHLASLSVTVLSLSWLAGCGGDTAPKPADPVEPKVDATPKTNDAPVAETPTGEPIVIAIAGPMTGSGAAFGEMIRNAAELKGKEINDAGGINGRPVKFQIEDDKGAFAEATSVSRKLTSDESIVAVIGHFNSDCSLAAKPEYNRVGILQLSPGSTNVDVCQGGDWTFRNLYRDDFQGEFLANFALKALELKKVAVIFEQDNYGTGLKEAFEAEAKKIGLELVALETYSRGRTLDFKPHMTKIKAAAPDGVFISGLYNEAALIIKTAKNDLGMSVPFFGGDGLISPDLLKNGGPATEGCYVTTPFLFGTKQETEKASNFLKAFKAMHNVEPDTWAALTYDACGQVIQAIEAIGTDRKAIRDHLAAQNTKEKGYDGVTGLTFFDENGDCPGKPIYVTQVIKEGEGGALKFGVSPKQLLE